jgi:hypothetical protein
MHTVDDQEHRHGGLVLATCGRRMTITWQPWKVFLNPGMFTLLTTGARHLRMEPSESRKTMLTVRYQRNVYQVPYLALVAVGE